jgi:hypothetical protein
MTIGTGTDRGLCARRPLYVSDLPGHDGLTPSNRNPSSDWGWTSDISRAIILTSYWQRRFIAYSRHGYGFNGRLLELSGEMQVTV